MPMSEALSTFDTRVREHLERELSKPDRVPRMPQQAFEDLDLGLNEEGIPFGMGRLIGMSA